MPIGQVSIGSSVRLGLAFLVMSLCAGLSGCSDPGTVTAQVNLQQAPANESEVLATIPSGSTVTVRNCTDGWCRISWNGRDGYILAKNVAIGGSVRRSANTGKPNDDDTQNDGNLPAPDSTEGAAPL